ncbi:hypothetical protein AAFF_G00203900 [Aldrovandia affinis]|uniref:Uncharacterized protein n=1 Tax=Aldrovandia affinis TaxID=143900 RepID=A0AAD7SX56_9TELE|nr:hypothetical protein AAFF_G00203900 [Aldrovandia affinis]
MKEERGSGLKGPTETGARQMGRPPPWIPSRKRPPGSPPAPPVLSRPVLSKADNPQIRWDMKGLWKEQLLRPSWVATAFRYKRSSGTQLFSNWDLLPLPPGKTALSVLPRL